MAEEYFRSLVLLFINTVKYFSTIFHRRGAEGAECVYFFAVERPANIKTQALRAKIKSDRRIAQFHLSKNCEYRLKLLIA